MPKKIRAKSSKPKKPLGGSVGPTKLITKHKSNSSTNPNRVIKGKKPHSYRDKATIKRLNMYNEKPNEEERAKRPTVPAMIEPDRRWFGNTRTITQDELEEFRKEVKEATHDPYSVLVNQTKLPLSLVSEAKPAALNLLQIEPFESTFGQKSKRRRPKLDCLSYEDLIADSSAKQNSYEPEKDLAIVKDLAERDLVRDKRLEAGQSKRIWRELYKVLDSSDVICQVLDVRDPMGTRCPHIENQLKKKPNKHLFFLLNKCDLVPTHVSVAWVKELSKEYPTIAFHASLSKPFGKKALISLLKQFDNFHKDKKNISVGFIGYPNVGKSSVINALNNKKMCKVAPIPGETKVWQYITLTKRIYLIDCPGVVYDVGDSDEALVLKGVVRAEKLEDPHLYIDGLLNQVSKDEITRRYGIQEWTDAEDFLSQIAFKSGRLLKKAEPDLDTVAKMIIHDWQRGKIAFFHLPQEV